DLFPPDERIFPQYYQARFQGITEDIHRQPLAFVSHLIENDLPLHHLLDSDWTIVNDRLALFYEMDLPDSDLPPQEFRVVPLASSQSHRGGLVGMAGVHRWGSDGSRTKPVERGKYILDVLFNDPPPPPPPNAGEVEPNLRGQRLTVRQRLEKHRQQETCRNCHRRIDPYGLALENFNVIGQWRDRMDGEKPIEQWGDDRPEIDMVATLPGGQTYQDYASFQTLLASMKMRFLRGFTEKLLAYALARGVVASDRPVINQLLQRAGGEEATLRSILRSLVASDIFVQK
ncbi:MAG: DUF1588 domain-containing protein, partial [Planctomycetota bacterium]